MGFNVDRRVYDVLRCMPTVPGAIGAFRRRVLLEVGGVSDDTLAEDTDLTYRLLLAGDAATRKRVREAVRVADRFLEATVYRRAGDWGSAEAVARPCRASRRCMS